MERFSKYKVEDFATESVFVKWVLAPDEKSNRFWEDFQNSYPLKKTELEEAKKLVLAMRATESAVPTDRLDILWAKIDESKTIKKSGGVFRYLRWVAVFILLLGSGAVYYITSEQHNFKFSQHRITKNDDARLLLADGSTTTLDQAESEIEVNATGEIIVNQDTIRSEPVPQKVAELNHVIMPYGKQTNLQLPDGTVVYVNAGTRLSFPSHFNNVKREVFLEGEALFEVHENKEVPFIVHTPDMDITVTGTVFNVSAYADDDYTQAVLVSGAVNVSKPGLFAKKIAIQPGESAKLDRYSGNILTRDVDPEIYTAWTKGYLIFRNEPLGNVFKKLERFYDEKIEMESELEHASFSGKLDVSKTLRLVMEDVAFASSVRVFKKVQKQTHYIIKP